MNFLQIHPDDNVAVMLDDSNPRVPRGHKFALRGIPAGAPVVKYGMPVGHATRDIRQGEHVHTHNLSTNLAGVQEYHYCGPPQPRAADPDGPEPPPLRGFLRDNGTAGIRNHVFIIPTVGCVNRLATTLAERLNRILPQDFPGRAIALTHPYGCSQLGQDHENTRNTLAALAKHPNAGATLVVGLGCENNTIDAFREAMGDFSPQRVRFLVAQHESDEVSAGMKLLEELVEPLMKIPRVPVPLRNLVVGLKCGGSDGLSGLTANPLVGRFSDWLTGHGGSTILGEVPEMFGAETLLMQRCKDRQTYRKCVKMVNDFKEYFTQHGQPICENPSPGNKEGGISTLEDKSLGCVQKAGCSPVNDVLLTPGEEIHAEGLNLLSGPGNDMVASTLLAASGAQLILFTTGRGTPFGTVVPTLKISSNSALAQHKPGWIDFDAGRLLHEDPQAVQREFFGKILAVANGEETANERNRDEQIALFKNGVTL